MASNAIETLNDSISDELSNDGRELKLAEHVISPELSLAIDLPAGTLATKSWTFERDPWKWTGTSGSDLAQISDISLALTRSDTPGFPYFSLRSVISYKKTSFGWETAQGGKKLTVNYKTSSGAIVYSYPLTINTFPPQPSEIRIFCNNDSEFFSYLHKIDIDIYNDISSATLNVDSHTWSKC
ncbi:hypothetical protein E3A20_19440 [Planctomyces bekefii]|uniref:Uncharacterized protein n=1 Tax=Planctomyces bekefii TaxID=1653850 RepID=A0A5C6M3S6_9PLAN|nr:hypothetical protein E3A20_19440 [Planctomyces bekefii]